MSKVVNEEGVEIKSYGDKISKELDVFYNPVMKLNRDISLIVLKTYFEKYNNKKIKFCDPMGASGIREIRFLKTIPDIFEKITIGDISADAILNIKNNFKLNEVSMEKVELMQGDAMNTISKQFYDFIEIDPFGSPVPFLDIACQRIKHNGILSVTATDTAALCGTYPKTTLRKYGMKVKKTLWLEEVGLRNLIAYCQIQAAKYERELIPMISYTSDHYYKIFFKVEEGRGKAYDSISKLKYLKWDKVTQETIICDYEEKDSFGKSYVGNLTNKEFLVDLKENLNLISDKKKITKLIDFLIDEIDLMGYYNPHKFQKEFNFDSSIKFDTIISKLKEKKYLVSKPHNNRLGIKTNCPHEEFLKIMKSENN